jgi:subtilisin family serine protease
MKKLFVALFAISILFAGTSSAKASQTPTVVVIDTGVDITNKTISNRIVGEVCILVQTTCPNGANFMEGPGAATLDPKRATANGFYHGTAMAGLVAENSSANIIAIRIIGMEPNGARSVSNVSVMERALQWVVDNKQKYNIVGVSMSQVIRTSSTCMTNKSIESNVAILKSVNVPVAAASTCEELQAEVDQVVCVMMPEDLCAIGIWYEDFQQTTDTEVCELLTRQKLLSR